jgi:hypothetical protein
MSGDWVPPGGEPAGRIPPAAGWYPDPEGWGALRWWDGTARAGAASWPASAQPGLPPATSTLLQSLGGLGYDERVQRGRVSAWLSNPAASPLLGLVATVTAIGWAGAAVVLAAAAAGAHPVLPAVTVDVSGFVLTVADLVAGIARRAGRAEPAWSAAASRAMRRAARRARRASSGPPVAVQAVQRLVRRRRRVFASLPRPVAWFFAAAISLTAGACPWVIFEGVSHGWYSGDLGLTAAGQQLAALIWMVHLIAWSSMACRRRDRTRAAAKMMPVVSADSR